MREVVRMVGLALAMLGCLGLAYALAWAGLQAAPAPGEWSVAELVPWFGLVVLLGFLLIALPRFWRE